MLRVILIATCLCLWQWGRVGGASLSVRVDSGPIVGPDAGDTLRVRVGTRVLLIADYDCAWEWRIENMNSQGLTAETSGVVRLLHIVPFTREEMGVYSCDYFGSARNLTLVAVGSNLFQVYGGHNTDGLRNNSVVLLSEQEAVDIQISCVQSGRLKGIGGYWEAPDGSDVRGTGNVYVREEAERGEAVLHVQGSDSTNITEGVYRCTTDVGESYTVLLYRAVYSVVRGSGERELLTASSETLYARIGEEISLVCPKDSVPDYIGADEGKIVKLIQILYIPLFTYNEAGLYHCKSDVLDRQVLLVATDSALLYYSSPSLTLFANNSVISLEAEGDGSVVCAGSRSGGGNFSSWFVNGRIVPVDSLVRLSPELGGLQLVLREITGMDQGLYVCTSSVVSSGGEVGRETFHSVSLYLAKLRLDILTEAGESLNDSSIIFLRSSNIREISCVSAEHYPALVSVNWTADSIGFRLDNRETLQLSELSVSALYTCQASSAVSTGSKSVYILLDTAHTNLSLSINSRTQEFSGPTIEVVEILVGVGNVVIDCIAFQPELTLPTGDTYEGEERASYTIQLMTPRYNGVVNCTGMSYDVTRVRLIAVGAALVREWEGGSQQLQTGISVVRDTEYFLCVGSDTTGRSGWDKPEGRESVFSRQSEYEEVLTFEPGETPEGFYTCRARNESGGEESFTQGLFSQQPHGPNVSISVNGTLLSRGEYNLTSNQSVLLECNSDSYPPALTTLWYSAANASELVSNSSRYQLVLSNVSLELVCVVTTPFATGEASVLIRNPLYYSDSGNSTGGDDKGSVFVLVAMVVLLVVVVGMPTVVVPVVYLAVREIPAEVKLHVRQFLQAHWGGAGAGESRERHKYDKHKLTVSGYKERYKLTDMDSHVREVSFWECKQIREEYNELRREAGVKEENYRANYPARTTPGVEVREHLTLDGAWRRETPNTHGESPNYETARPSSASSTEHTIIVSDQRPLLTPNKKKPRYRRGFLSGKEGEGEGEGYGDNTLLNIPECPDFIIVKGFYGTESSVCRKSGKKRSDLEKSKKIEYLDFLFERRPNDVVFIGHYPEEGSEKFNEFVFYPHGPKDKPEKYLRAKEDARSYQVTTVSCFSSQFYTLRQLIIREEKKGTLEIRLFNFLNWPQVEVGSKTYPFMEFVRCFWYKKQEPYRKRSIVLHCDAGPRCATFISIYYLLKRVDQGNDFNLFEFFVRLYKQAGDKGLEMFPTRTQYEFLHSIILDLTLSETSCMSGEMESRFKRLFGQPRDYNPWREDRVGRYLKELEGLVTDASKQPQEIADEKYQVIQALEERYQRQQKRKADRREGEKGKGKKETVEKEEDTYRSDDEIEYVEDRRRFIATLSSQLAPEALYIKKDQAARRFRKEQRQKEREQKKKEEPLKVDKGIESSKEEYKQLQLFKPHLLHSFAHPPSDTRYRTHKKHLEEGRMEAVREQWDKEKGGERMSGPRTNKRGLNIEEKLSLDECTRYEQFLFGARQVQVYGPNITEENQSQGFWLHSLYGQEIIATRHPGVNDFEYANYNNPQFNLYLYKQHKVSTVIALCTFEELIAAYRAKRNLKYENSKREGKQAMSPYWLPVGQEENFGPFKVKTMESAHLDEKRVMEWFDLEYRDTKDRDTGDIDQHNVRLFLCKDWPTLMETNHTTGRHDRFVQFMKSVVAYTKSSRSEKIAVHCSDTKPYSAEFSAVFYALRQAECEGKIDMYQIMKGIQTSRRPSSGLVTEDQYFLTMSLTSDCLLSVAQASQGSGSNAPS